MPVLWGALDESGRPHEGEGVITVISVIVSSTHAHDGQDAAGGRGSLVGVEELDSARVRGERDQEEPNKERLVVHVGGGGGLGRAGVAVLEKKKRRKLSLLGRRGTRSLRSQLVPGDAVSTKTGDFGPERLRIINTKIMRYITHIYKDLLRYILGGVGWGVRGRCVTT